MDLIISIQMYQVFILISAIHGFSEAGVIVNFFVAKYEEKCSVNNVLAGS